MFLKPYINYFSYILKHKWNVALECFKMGLYWHAVTHDISKLLPSEFFGYVEFYYKVSKNLTHKKTDEQSLDFQYAWLNHQKRNRHHWNFWVSVSDGKTEPLPMPEKYVKQMVCDWRAIGKISGRAPKTYYEENKHNMLMHEETVKRLFKYIGE